MTDSQKYARVDTFDPAEHSLPLNGESEEDYLPCYRFPNRGSFVLWRLVGVICSFEYIEESIPVGSEVLFYAEIIKYKPSSDPKTWKIIGNHMSKVFIEENQSYPLFNEQDYADLFLYLARNQNRSVLPNRQTAPSATTNPPNEDVKVNEMPVCTPNLGEAKSITNVIDSENNENDVSKDNTDNDTVEHNNTTNVQSTIPNSQERAFKFRAKARVQAIQSFNESDERYWNTLYPDFAD
ncbi:hypothetical protein C6P45_000604 [Maudiozyma exigua]|uniref:Uncharacterized protein n=1 Tax=Maudiozyma exigua TaxID=34358 RepID=A0A9P6WEM2_MAUEX|nr:hypothetical protein C6P45_000604 [Kazachstania exigua]